MTPAGDRPFLQPPRREPLAMLVVGAVALAAAVRVADGAHPQLVLLDALLWLVAIAAAFAWYALLRRISDRVAHRWREAMDACETRLAEVRRDILIAARGDPSIIRAADHRWPGDIEAVALVVAITAHALRAASAFLLGVGIVAIGMGVPDPFSAESGASTIAYALSFSIHAVLASWLDLGWRWLAWRTGLRAVGRARRFLDSA